MTSSPRSPERAAVGARAQRGRRQRAAAFEGRGDIYGQVSIASRLLFLLLTSAWWYARRISDGSLGGSLLCRPRPLRPFSFFPFYFSPLSPFAERRRSVDDALRRQAQEVSKRGILLRLFELPLKYFKKEIPARAAFFFFSFCALHRNTLHVRVSFARARLPRQVWSFAGPTARRISYI